MQLGSTSRGFLDLLGVDTERIPANADVYFSLNHEPSSWGVFVLVGVVVAIAVAVFFLYQREHDTCPLPAKIFLAVFRFIVLLVIVLIFLEPTVRWEEEQSVARYVVVLRDRSASMETVDKYDDVASDSDPAPGEIGLADRVAQAVGRNVETIQTEGVSRREILNTLIERDDFAFIRDLLHKGHVQIIDFGDSVSTPVRRIPAIIGDETAANDDENNGATATTAGKVAVPPLEAAAPATDLRRAIEEALTVNPLAAIIILTDGQHTAGYEPLNTPAEAAQKAGDKDVPIFVVGIGDPTKRRNLKVRDIYVRNKVWPDEPFEIRTEISAQKIAAQDVKLELIEHQVSEDGTTDEGKVVETQPVSLSGQDEIKGVIFSRVLRRPGLYRYAVRVQQVEGESNLEDNYDVTESALEVVDEKVRVLLIAGTPTWDFQLVKNLLTRDSSIAVSCWLQSMDKERPQEGDVPITKLPTTRRELAEYHVVMMMDPNPIEFDAEWMELLHDFVSKQAGGVMYMAGPHYSGIFLSLKRTSAVNKLLPVRVDEALDAELLIESVSTRQAWPLRPVVQHVDHPVLRFFEDPKDTLRHWEHMPGVFWSFPTAGAKPTTQVLIEHSDTTLRDAPRPLVVAGRYGSGSTAFVGTNETFRWRRVGRQAAYFDRFWIQMVRYLVETRSLQGRRRGHVGVGKERYEVGEKIVFSASLKDVAYEDLKEPEVEALLKRAGGESKPITLRSISSRPGEYEATMRAVEPGRYTLTVKLPGVGTSDEDEVTTSFEVTLPNVESADTSLNEITLNEIALAAGGKYFHVNEINRLLAAVPNEIDEIQYLTKPVLMFSPDDSEDRRFSFLLVFIVMLLGTEWAIRKVYKLL